MIKMACCGIKSAFVNILGIGFSRKSWILPVNAKKCLACDNETYQEDGMCVLCKTGLTRIDDELRDAFKFKKDERWNL
jgi:hypothetical protein